MKYSFGSDSYSKHYARPSRGVEVGEYGPAASGFSLPEDPMTQTLLYGAVGVAAGAALMHLAIKYNWLGMARMANQAPAQTPAQLPAQSPAQAPASAPSQGVRVVSVG